MNNIPKNTDHLYKWYCPKCKQYTYESNVHYDGEGVSDRKEITCMSGCGELIGK